MANTLEIVISPDFQSFFRTPLQTRAQNKFVDIIKPEHQRDINHDILNQFSAALTQEDRHI
jgi:hypothetical protein